jgi:catechol 2,3-dioxygenase-like lactoylglutathione lyase family enzyme
MTLALSGLQLHARDLAKSVAFYTACGLPLVERRHGGPVHHTCSLGGVHFAIYPDDAASGPQSASTIGITVPNLQNALNALRALGAKIVEEPRPRPWGVSAIVEDPDGRRVELLATQSEMTGPVPR